MSVNHHINNLDQEINRELIYHINPLSPCQNVGIQLYMYSFYAIKDVDFQTFVCILDCIK